MFSNLTLRANSLFIYIKKSIDVKKIFYIEADYIWGRFFKLFEWRSKLVDYSLTLGAAIHMIDLVMWFLNDKPKKGADNKLICFLHPKDTNGVLIELCQEIK